MRYKKLGTTDLDVSLICLGTMTYGEQNTEAEGFEQMDYALAQGINFFDTAEMYAVPPRAETCGKTEEIIGNWMKARQNRKDIIIATKIAGPGMSWIRQGQTRHNKENIDQAVAASLKRLQTDYIDLYQLHWPERPVNSFGKRDFDFESVRADEAELMHHSLTALDAHVKAGRIRHIGLSNETAFGLMTFLSLAEKHHLPRTQSVQNVYNLLNRAYEGAMAEISLHTKAGLLAYSPLARGTLTGKYLNGQVPAGSSRAIDKRKSRYDYPNAERATAAYVAVAKKHQLDPAQMAIAYVNQKPFVTSNIIGATTMAQLKTNIASIHLTLSPEILADIEAVHLDIPNPSA